MYDVYIVCDVFGIVGVWDEKEEAIKKAEEVQGAVLKAPMNISLRKHHEDSEW